MNSINLPPPEFWFYRVYSELTLSLLHQVNNELTGVAFLAELIEDDVEGGVPAGEKFQDLRASIEKVIQLTKQTMDVHMPIELELGGSSHNLGDLLDEGISMLRLVLPKTVAVRIKPPPLSLPRATITKKDFLQVLAALGMLLAPPSSRAPGELVIEIEPSTGALLFFPSYPIVGLAAAAASDPEDGSPTKNHKSQAPHAGPGVPTPSLCDLFLAANHRVGKFGGKIELFQSSDEPAREGLRMALAATIS
ncbi:MAG: hypothetical protein WCS65_11305 [Verrucomicrobiae bacterium]